MTAGTADVEPVANQEGIAHPAVKAALSLRANFAWTLAGNSVYAACQWGVLVALAKLGSAEIVGRFALALALTAPVLMLTNLQLRNIQATDARHEHHFGEYMGLRLAMTGLALLIIAALVLVLRLDPAVAGIVVVVGGAKCVEAISDIIYGAFQQQERMDKMAISMCLKGVASLAALSAGIYLTHDLLWGGVGLAAAWLLVLLTYDLPNCAMVIRASERHSALGDNGAAFSPIRPVWSRGNLVALARLSLPLGIVMLLISLNANIPRYFIEHFLGTRELGFFAAIAYLLVAGNTIVNALGTSASPRLSKFFATHDTKRFKDLLTKSVGIGVVMGLVGLAIALLAGSQVLRFLYHEEYAGYSEVLVWMMVAAALSYVASFLGFGMTAARRFKAQAPLFAAVTAATIAGSALLIPAYHLLGAAIAITLAALLQVLGSLWVVVRALGEHRATWAN